MHTPVLVQEVIKYLRPKKNENFIDGTVGEGGHALEILKHNGPKGLVLGIDWDSRMVEALRERELSDRLLLAQGNYRDMGQLSEGMEVSGVLLDLGLSMVHLKKSGKGFTFSGEEPLDMRYSENGVQAKEILNKWPEEKLEEIIRDLGGERFAHKIAQEIVRFRENEELETNKQLVRVIKKSTPTWYHQRRIHPATKTFQALRIVANDELGNIEAGLPEAWDVLEEGGRLVVISFHSLEDKLVKDFLKEKVRKGLACLQFRGVVRPTEEEMKENPSSRSALLRSAIKINKKIK